MTDEPGPSEEVPPDRRLDRRARSSEAQVYDDTDRRGARRRAALPDRRRAQRRSDLIGHAIRDQLDVEALLHEAVVAIGSFFSAARVHVDLIDVASQSAEPVAAQWFAEGLGALEAPPGNDVFGPLIDELSTRTDAIVIDDTKVADEELVPLLAYLGALGIGACLLAPMSGTRGLIGLLSVSDTKERSWTDDEIRLIEIAAGEVASALERARLFAAQQELVRQLQELDRAKSEFLSTVSHELRTPLTSIAGYIEMLQDGDAGPISDEQDRMLDVVARNARRLRSLIEDLLTLSRIEIGSFRGRADPVDLTEVLQSACAVIEPAQLSGGVELIVDASSDLGTVIGDADQLERVVLNLLSNAVKFTPTGGRVELRASRDDDAIVIAVSDTGIGIPADELELLFTRFFRASNATRRSIPGTGLGLTIVASIVELHGGSLGVESTVDVGTTFTVRLPTDRMRSAPTAAISDKA